MAGYKWENGGRARFVCADETDGRCLQLRC